MLTQVKPSFRRIVEAPARGLIGLGLTPNAVTLAALAISLVLCALLAWTGWLLVFIPLLGLSLLLDALDGPVARLSGRVTKTGGYLDALCDRLADGALCLALAAATDHWRLYFVVALGAGVFSYAKARAEMEAPSGNDAWPDLMERTERCAFLLVSAFAYGLFPTWTLAGLDVLDWALGALALLVYASLTQRVLRAVKRLGLVDRS
jgi:CDP-diacylglycerol--glycerol-3-phosphate 3-phosphatidyltransferase